MQKQTDVQLELLTPMQMGEADQLTIDGGISGVELMENAGQAVFSHITQNYSEYQSVLIICGPGNNGGDGFVVARKLAEVGKKVNLFLLGDVEKLKGDAAVMASRWQQGVYTLTLESLRGYLESNQDHILVVDALFGAGLNRDITGGVLKIVEYINKHNCPVVSIDIPSGIDGESGATRGAALQASSSITFFRYKPGHLLMPGAEYCGKLECQDIGIKTEVFARIKPTGFLNDPALWLDKHPALDLNTHKYKRGHTIVVSGSMYKTGAARLAAMSALRMGSGLVTVFSPADAMNINASHLTAIMLEECSDNIHLAKLLQDTRKNAVLIGPGAGVGKNTKSNVLSCLKSQSHVVLDADALTSFEDNPEELFSAISHKQNGHVVLTPHHGEFERLFRIEIRSSSKIERATYAAKKSGAVVVYKGSDTVIASPEGQYAINNNAPPFLATAGSGDALAGMIISLLGQGMRGFEAACAGVWCHGESGKLFGYGLIAEDFPAMIPEVIKGLNLLKNNNN